MAKKLFFIFLSIGLFLGFSNASSMSDDLIQSSIQEDMSLIPFIISFSEGYEVAYMCNGDSLSCGSMSDTVQIKKDGDTYYTCNGDSLSCGNMSDTMQIKKDGDTHYVCNGDSLYCSSMSDIMQIKKDGDTYRVCDGNSLYCSSMSDIVQIKKDGDTYYVCNGDSLYCSNMSDTIQIKKDGDMYYVCNGDSLYCSSMSDIMQIQGETMNVSDENIDAWIDNLLKDNLSSQSTTMAYTMDDVVLWMYNIGLTSKRTVADFLPNSYLTREQASKFFVEFAKKVKGTQNNNTSKKVAFTDIGNADKTLKSYIIEANQMDIINGYKNKFSPFDKLTKAQALAILIRIKDGKLDETTNPRYLSYEARAKVIYEIIDINNSFGIDLDKEYITRREMGILFYKMKNYIK